MTPARRNFPNLFEREGESGAALVEFALVVPVLFALLAGTVDLGFYVNNLTQVSSAAEAAALYAQNYGQTGDAANIENAGDYAGVAGITISTPTCFWGCPNGNQVANLAVCSATQPANCSAYGANSDSPGQYVQVSASMNRYSMFNFFPGLPATITRTVTVRTQ